MRVTIRDLRRMKRNGEKIPMITAYDYTSAQLVEQAGIPLVLVGDSLGQVVLGYDSTVPVTMDEMVHHIKTVVRGTQRAHVVGDLPFLSYHADVSEAIRNAGRLLKEGGAQSVKLEGGRTSGRDSEPHRRERHPGHGPHWADAAGSQPAGRLPSPGQEPQGRGTSHGGCAGAGGGWSIRHSAGVCSRSACPQMITERVGVPTIGIGAGAGCDGQVQVFHDMMGLYQDFTPKHARQYAQLGQTIVEATRGYIQDVENVRFPGRLRELQVERQRTRSAVGVLREAGLTR